LLGYFQRIPLKRKLSPEAFRPSNIIPFLVGSDSMEQKRSDMKSPIHATFHFPACPFLPEVSHPHGHTITRSLGPAKCDPFYFAALSYAQSLWREGKPAQAILQLNKAFMADLRGDEEVLGRFPPPYAALVWMLRNRPADRFLGNPVRHFQHLATRVNGERKEIRSWRAWACFHLSQRVLPEEEFPADEEQIKEEEIVFPVWGDVLAVIRQHGWRGEAEVLEEVGSAL
jgi:hypothetical protein